MKKNISNQSPLLPLTITGINTQNNKDCHTPQIRPKQVVEVVKDDFHRFRVKSSHFTENRIITFSTRKPAKLRIAEGLQRSPEKRDSVMNWSNRVYDTALVRNICCPFAFLATLSLPRCRRKLYDTASCRHVGGRAPPTPEASALLPVDNVR